MESLSLASLVKALFGKTVDKTLQQADWTVRPLSEEHFRYAAADTTWCAHLRTALEDAGSSFERVLKTTVYVASGDRADLVRVWGVVEAGFAPARPPSTLLGVAALG